MELKYNENLSITNEQGEQVDVKMLRVKLDNLSELVKEIIINISDLSWINNFSNEALRIGFIERSKQTIEKITRKLEKNIEDPKINEIGEIVISNVARLIVESTYDYYVLPLAELIKEKISNNPGFDYHFVNNNEIPIFGEAKYSAGDNAYGRALSQVVDFINEKKDRKEIPILKEFMTEPVIKNIIMENKGYSISFSATNIDNKKLFYNVMQNKDFKQLLKYKEILVVAVDV